MYKLKLFLKYLVHLYVCILFNGKKVYIFAGLRRSGNHACIDWIANAVEGKKTKFNRIAHKAFATESRKILHLNEVNAMGIYKYFQWLRELRYEIKRSPVIFISIEDRLPGKNDPYVPNQSTIIFISRSLLNTVASRITYAIAQAKDGMSHGDMNIDTKFFDICNEIKHNKQPGIYNWNYDEWINKPNEYRKKFLYDLGLEHDLAPDLGQFGGGSSFKDVESVTIESKTKSRWMAIQWPERVLDLIQENGAGLLTEEEKFFVRSLR